MAKEGGRRVRGRGVRWSEGVALVAAPPPPYAPPSARELQTHQPVLSPGLCPPQGLGHPLCLTDPLLTDLTWLLAFWSQLQVTAQRGFS